MTQFLTLSGAPGDDGPGAETATIFDAIAAAAPAFTDVARIRIFYTEREHFGPFAAVRAPYLAERLTGNDFPVSTGIITGGRGGEAPVLELEATIGDGKEVFFAPEVWTKVKGSDQPLPYSHAAASDGVMFVSGQVSYDLGAEIVGSTLDEQLAFAMGNFEHILRAAGRVMADVACFTVYVVEAGFDRHCLAVQQFERRLADWFGDAVPVVVWVGVKELFQPGLLVEVEAAVSVGTGVRVSAEQTEVVGSPHGATVARAGEWVFANGTATATAGGEADAALAQAWATVEAALTQVGLDARAVDRVTAWVAAEPVRGPLAAALAALLPGAATLVAPLVAQPGDEGRVLLEVIGRSAE